MKNKQRLLITLVIGIFLVLGFFYITGSITKHTGFSISEFKEDDFVSCLKKQKISLYINTEGAAKTLKKIILFDYLQYFQITNCLNNNQECLKNKVDSFPTWIINENKINKDINFNELSEYSGCKVIENS
jgi:hypothetical protein